MAEYWDLYDADRNFLGRTIKRGDAFEKDANRLAFAELKELIKYQKMGFCLKQLSEAVKEKYERIEWESKYLISSE